jgi:hypothetical protein
MHRTPGQPYTKGPYRIQTIAERAEKWSIPEPNSGCHLWCGCIDKKGYGRMTIRGVNGQAHRLLYEERHGPLPADILVCHKCDVRSCVNIDRLWSGTAKDNTADMIKKNRHWRGGATPKTKIMQVNQ